MKVYTVIVRLRSVANRDVEGTWTLTSVLGSSPQRAMARVNYWINTNHPCYTITHMHATLGALHKNIDFGAATISEGPVYD